MSINSYIGTATTKCFVYVTAPKHETTQFINLNGTLFNSEIIAVEKAKKETYSLF